MKKLSKILILFLFIFGASAQVSAHATPITYEPEASTTLKAAPKEVAINFSERIDEAASGITVFAPDGSQAEIAEAKKSPTDPRRFLIPIKDMGEGVYTVAWQVVSSDDGHFTKGGFSFGVGENSIVESGAGGQIQIQHITTLPQAFTIGVELLGQTLLLGALLFLIFFWRNLKKENLIHGYSNKVSKFLSAMISIGGCLILLGTVSFIVLKTLDLIQLRSGTFTEILKVFLSTVDGRYALIRGILGLLSVAIFWIFRKEILEGEWKKKGMITLFVFIGAMLLIRARVSHAAASHFFPMFSILVNALQLLFKEAWVGLVMVAALLVTPLLLKVKDGGMFNSFFTQLSKLLNWVFAGVGITGAYIVWLHLKDPSYLFSTEWGARFILLSLVGGAFLLMRLYHVFLMRRKEKLIVWSPATLMLEMWIGVALVFVTSLIIITTPPYTLEKYSFNREAVSGNVTMRMSVYPYESSKLLINIEDTKTKSQLPVTNMVVTLTNEDKGIGPIVAETTERFTGGYALERSLFAPIGTWRVDITASHAGGYDAVTSFKINYPTDIEGSLINPDKRYFDWFAAMCILAAILVGMFSFYVNRYIERSSDNPILIKGNFKKWTSLILSLVVTIIAIFGIRLGYNTFLKTSFQKLCETNGHFWIQSVPIRDGKALSSETVTGCFLDVGMYHFADMREYEAFYKRREMVPEVIYTPSVPIAGEETEIMIDLSEVKEGKRIEQLPEIGMWHDRIMHVLVVGEDMKTFAHIHSESLGPITEEMKKTGRFPFRYTFPKAGNYVFNIDYVISGIEYTDVVRVRVEGEQKLEPHVSTTTENKPVTKNFEGYDVTFKAPKIIKAGEMVSLSYHIEKDGKPVTDLEPYLGAAMHLGLVRNDMGRFFHTHGEASMPGSVWFQQALGKYKKYHMHFAPEKFGPNMITPYWSTKFTTPGIYTVFGEFEHEGKVIVTDFEVKVE